MLVMHIHLLVTSTNGYCAAQYLVYIQVPVLFEVFSFSHIDDNFKNDIAQPAVVAGFPLRRRAVRVIGVVHDDLPRSGMHVHLSV